LGKQSVVLANNILKSKKHVTENENYNVKKGRKCNGLEDILMEGKEARKVSKRAKPRK
jgi:hypothetical protein